MIIHIQGFVGKDEPDYSTQASVHDGSGPADMARISTGILNQIKAQGYEIKTGTLRSLDGYLKAVHATVVTSETSAMWHLFTEPSEKWPLAETEQ